MYFRMILFSYTCLVIILAFIVTVQADTKQTLNNNELSLSLSNEQVTEYNYKRIIQSTTTENNQDNSITTNINTEFIQKTLSGNEIDLQNTDSKPFDQDYDSNGNMLSDNSFMSSYQLSRYNGYNIQNKVDVNGEIPTTAVSSPGSYDFPSSAYPSTPNGNIKSISSDVAKINDVLSQPNAQLTYPVGVTVNMNTGIPNYPQMTSPNSANGAPYGNLNNGSPSNPTQSSPNANTNSISSDAAKKNGVVSQPNTPLTYSMGVPVNMNAGVPKYPQTSSPNSANGTLNRNPIGGPPSTSTPTATSNGSPHSSSPSSTIGGLTDKPYGQDYDSNGNLLSDNSFMSSYQLSRYNGYNIQNKVDVNGEIPTTAVSSPGSDDFPSSAYPSTPNGNIKSISSDVAKINDVLSQPNAQLTYPVGVTVNMNTGIPNYPQTTSPNSANGAPYGNLNNGSPSNPTQSSPNANTNSISSDAAKKNGVVSQPNTPLTYSMGVPVNMNAGVPKYPQTSSPNSANGTLNRNPIGGPPSTSTPTATSNGSPHSSSPSSTIGGLTDKPYGQDYDSNGNLLSDNSFMSSYQLSRYNGYNIQNKVDVNGEIPTTAVSSPGSDDFSSSAYPSTPNGNIKSISSDVAKVNDVLSQPNAQLTYPVGVSVNMNTGIPNYPQTTSPNSANGAPYGNLNNGSPSNPTQSSPNVNTNSISSDAAKKNGVVSQPNTPLTNSMGVPVNMNAGVPKYPQTSSPNSANGTLNRNPIGGPPSTSTPTATSNGSPHSSSPSSTIGGLTDKPYGQDYDSNGNLLSDTSFMSSYQLSRYNGYNIQNKVDVNGEIPTTAVSSPGSDDFPSSAYPSTPNGNIKSISSDVAKINDVLSQPNAQLTYPVGVSVNMNTGIPNYPQTTSPNSANGAPYGNLNNGFPSNPTQSSHIANTNSISSDAAKKNGVVSQPNTPLTYSMGVPVNMNAGVPKYPQTSSPNSANGTLNRNPIGGPPSTSTPTATSNGSPHSSSPSSTIGGLTDKPYGQDYDSNGNLLSDNSFMSSYQLSRYNGYNIQNKVDVNGEIPTTAVSSPGSDDFPSSAYPSTPNGNIKSISSDVAKVNDVLSQPNAQLTYPVGVSVNMNTGIPNYPQTTSPNSANGAPYGNLNNGSPSNPTQSSPNANTNSISSDAAKKNGVVSQPNTPLTYSMGVPVNMNAGVPKYPQTSSPNSANGTLNRNPIEGPPSTSTPTATSNGSPISSSPSSTIGDLTVKPNGEKYGSNVNKLSDNSFLNSYQSLSYYGYIQNTADQDSSYNYPPEMIEDSNNQILQYPYSTFNLQNTITPPTLPNGNSNDSPSGGGTGLKTLSDINGSPYTVDTPVGADYSSMGSGRYGSSNYDIGYGLHDMDVVDVLNDNQLNMDNRYISDIYDDAYNDGVNNPLLTEYGDVYNYFYAENSENTEQRLDGNYDFLNGDSYVDGYFVNVPYDNGNMQEPSNEPYASNLNAMYENSQLQYENQNAPPFRGYPFVGNDMAPYDTNIHSDNNPQMSVMNSNLYNYNYIGGIAYDQTKIGMDETSPGNNQLSIDDFNRFPNTQIAQTTDSLKAKDLASDNQVYDFVDADNRDLVTVNSNYVGQLNENNVYNAEDFNRYNNMQSINVPEYNQLNRDYTTNYLSNLGTFKTSSSNTGTDAAVNGPEGLYLTPQLLNSDYNFPSISDLNKQSSDLNSLLIDNVQLNGYMYRTTDTSNGNTQVDGSAIDNVGSPMNGLDNRFKSIQTTVPSKNNELNVGQNVYGANGQIIGIIYKPSDIFKTNNRHKYSGSSSYSSPNDGEFFDDMHAIGNDIKRSSLDAISNVHDNIKDAYDTTKAVGKAVGNIARNATRKAADGVEKTGEIAYKGSKDTVEGIGNVVGEAADDVGEAAKDAHTGTKEAVKGVGHVVGKAVDDVGETAKDAYKDSKDAVKAAENTISADSVDKTPEMFY